MILDAPNPTQVQFTPSSKRANPPVPLVLIHDGGGTTFSYFMIGNLRREVWAIHNPRHWTTEPWQGGIPEMASQYIDLIHAAGIRGPILLGGWSFGGYLALTMANILARKESPSFTIAGLLIIDSPFPTQATDETIEAMDLDSDALPSSLLNNWPELVRKSFEQCSLMLENWQPPPWDGSVCGGKNLQVDVGGASWDLKVDSVLHKPVGGTWQVVKTRTQEQSTSTAPLVTPPPAVMMRCTQATPAVFDPHRNETLLGWEESYPSFIKAVIDTDAEHFTLFDKGDRAKTKLLTAQVSEALTLLQNLGNTSH